MRKTIADITDLAIIADSGASWEMKYNVLYNCSIREDLILLIGWAPKWKSGGGHKVMVRAFVAKLLEIRDELRMMQ